MGEGKDCIAFGLAAHTADIYSLLLFCVILMLFLDTIKSSFDIFDIQVKSEDNVVPFFYFNAFMVFTL